MSWLNGQFRRGETIAIALVVLVLSVVVGSPDVRNALSSGASLSVGGGLTEPAGVLASGSLVFKFRINSQDDARSGRVAYAGPEFISATLSDARGVRSIKTLTPLTTFDANWVIVCFDLDAPAGLIATSGGVSANATANLHHTADPATRPGTPPGAPGWDCPATHSDAAFRMTWYPVNFGPAQWQTEFGEPQTFGFVFFR